MRIAVSGASGLVGQALMPALENSGHQIVRMVRPQSSHRDRANDSIAWDPQRGLQDPASLQGVDAIIHLAGRSIASKRWSEGEKQRIRDSRVAATERLVEQLGELENPPPTFISASAIGIYGDSCDGQVDESSPAASTFLADVAVGWEAASRPLVDRGIRVVYPRLGIVLSRHGGALGKTLPLFRWGLGGKLSNGGQIWSWISLNDCVRALVRFAEDRSTSGIYNLTSPNPVSNAQFTAAVAATLHRPALVPAPAWLLRTVLGEMANALLLTSCHVAPRRLIELGFAFEDPELSSFLAKELG